MKRPKQGSTIKQVAYATRMMNGDASSKKEAALLSGYTMSMAENAKYKIEDTEGYKNAMIHLAQKSNNLLMAVMYEFEVRGLKDFNNNQLIAALGAISKAWDKIDTKRQPAKMKTPEGNPLRAVFTKRVETQTVTLEEKPAPANTPKEEPANIREAEVDEPNPFDESDVDEMYEEAKTIVIVAGKASTSYLQRKLLIGYARAARLLDLLEQNGVISEQNGSKPRKVLIEKDEEVNPFDE